jgi:hypothetical protein
VHACRKGNLSRVWLIGHLASVGGVSTQLHEAEAAAVQVPQLRVPRVVCTSHASTLTTPNCVDMTSCRWLSLLLAAALCSELPKHEQRCSPTGRVRLTWWSGPDAGLRQGSLLRGSFAAMRAISASSAAVACERVSATLMAEPGHACGSPAGGAACLQVDRGNWRSTAAKQRRQTNRTGPWPSHQGRQSVTALQASSPVMNDQSPGS